MRVNKFKVRIPNTTSGTTLNVPISITFNPVDQAEVVENDFVKEEISNSINEITDYEKTKFIPITVSGVQVSQIQYDINLLNGGTFPTQTTYNDAGFVYDDILYRKSRFKNSFIRLAFYDSDVTTNQNLITYMTLFSKLYSDDIVPLTSSGVPVTGGGLPKPINQIPIRFYLEDPITNPNGTSEGYHIYNYKEDVMDGMPKELYMRASWNNAATGESLGLITDPVPQTIENLIPKLHMRYILTRGVDGFYYKIDPTYSTPNNVSMLPNNIVNIQLYQIQVL